MHSIRILVGTHSDMANQYQVNSEDIEVFKKKDKEKRRKKDTLEKRIVLATVEILLHYEQLYHSFVWNVVVVTFFLFGVKTLFC